MHKTRVKIELIGLKKKNNKIWSSEAQVVKYNCRTRLQDRHLHILTKYLLRRFYDNKNIEIQIAAAADEVRENDDGTKCMRPSLHSMSEKVDVRINNLHLGASFYGKVIETLAVTVTVKITVTSNNIA